MRNKAIFLDRDGVLNRALIKAGKPYPPASLEEFEIPDEVLPGLNKLKELDYFLLVVTNQPDVSRGLTTKIFVETLHEKLRSQLPLNKIYVCYHDDSNQCGCRKPHPGLLFEAAKEYKIDLKKSVIIGDRWKDVEAGKRADCKTVWLDFNYQEPFLSQPPDYIAKGFMQAVNWITQTLNKEIT